MTKNHDVIDLIDDWASFNFNRSFPERVTYTLFDIIERAEDDSLLFFANALLYEVYKDAGGLDD